MEINTHLVTCIRLLSVLCPRSHRSNWFATNYVSSPDLGPIVTYFVLLTYNCKTRIDKSPTDNKCAILAQREQTHTWNRHRTTRNSIYDNHQRWMWTSSTYCDEYVRARTKNGPRTDPYEFGTYP